MSGKWHVSAAAVQPLFDVVKNPRGGMPNQTPEGYNRPIDEEHYKNGWRPWETKYGGFWKGGKHWREVLADDGVEFLKQAGDDDKPFCLYYSNPISHGQMVKPLSKLLQCEKVT